MFRLQLVPRLIPNSMRTLSIFALAAFWLLVLSPAADAFDIVQITNNTTIDERPDVSGSKVVWQDRGDGTTGSEYEILLWDGATITQISNGSTWNDAPAIDGSNVVWYGCDGGTAGGWHGWGLRRSNFWDGSFPIVPTQITNNGSIDDRNSASCLRRERGVVWAATRALAESILVA